MARSPTPADGGAAYRPLVVAHNWRDAAPLQHVAHAMARAGAAVDWRATGVDASVQWRTDPPDALLLRESRAALLEREWLPRAPRGNERPPAAGGGG